MLRLDVSNPRHTTSEPHEHIMFGNICSEKRELSDVKNDKSVEQLSYFMPYYQQYKYEYTFYDAFIWIFV
jgi:hypothetical protein